MLNTNKKYRRGKSLEPRRKTIKNVSAPRRRSLKPTKNIEKMYKNVEAEKVGEGGYGIVSRPPSKCGQFFSETNNTLNNNQKNVNRIVYQNTYFGNKNYISKLTEYFEASKELNIGNTIKKNITNWRDYFCFIEFLCEAPKEKHIRVGMNDYQDTYAIAPYCGITLKDILDEKYKISLDRICCLVDSVRELIIGLGKLHWIQVFHQDIWDENVLFNPEDGKLRLIDWGLADDLYEEKKRNENRWESIPVIVNSQLTDLDNLIFDILKPVLQFVGYTIDNYRKKLNKTGKELPEKLKNCLDEADHFLSEIPERVEEEDFPNRKKNEKAFLRFKYDLKEKYVNLIKEFIGDYENNQKCKYL
jgi:serine/threonine protein kinase